MVMIPTDVGVQVRSQTEGALHPVRPVPEIPGDLPELKPGQAFRAHIQEVLPENTFKALVAGRLLTLALPEGAKVGDTLDLVAIERTPRAIVAQLAERGAGDPYQHATLSRTGQLIASLLGRDGGAAAPAVLNRGQPLLPQAPVNAAALAASLPPRLAQAVGGSGLFYEAHQVQWAQGQRPLASLLAEPQGRHSNPATLAALGASGTGLEAAATSALAARRDGAAAPPPASLLQTLFGGETAPGAAAAESRQAAAQGVAALTIPDDLRPLVQQQLEAAATQRLAWHGEVWPKQVMEWEVERDAAQGDAATDAAASWQTRLRLTLPRLGAIDARIRLNGQTVQLVLAASDAAATADLGAAAPALQQALAEAGLVLQAVDVTHGGA